MKKTMFEEWRYLYFKAIILSPVLYPMEGRRTEIYRSMGQRHLRYLKEYRRGVYSNLLTRED